MKCYHKVGYVSSGVAVMARGVLSRVAEMPGDVFLGLQKWHRLSVVGWLVVAKSHLCCIFS